MNCVAHFLKGVWEMQGLWTAWQQSSYRRKSLSVLSSSHMDLINELQSGTEHRWGEKNKEYMDLRTREVMPKDDKEKAIFQCPQQQPQGAKPGAPYRC